MRLEGLLGDSRRGGVTCLTGAATGLGGVGNRLGLGNRGGVTCLTGAATGLGGDTACNACKILDLNASMSEDLYPLTPVTPA